MSKKIIIVAGLITLVFVGGYFFLQGNGNQSPESNLPQSQQSKTSLEKAISMEARSFSFSPNTIQARVGESTRIDITSVGQHTFTIDELDVNVITPHGQITEVKFTPNKKGTFQFYCAVPGHQGAGQIGTIIVE